MTEAVKILTLLDLIFVILLAMTGYVGGVLGDLMYYCVAFTLPVAVGFYASLSLKRKREEIAGVREEDDKLLSFDLGKTKSLLPVIAPSVAIVFTVSLLTSLILSHLGVSSPGVENTGIVRMLFVHAVAPAILEEALFRYIPMKLLAPYSKRFCVFYSAFCFAMIHCSFSQMPYAFIAGVVFMAVDLAVGSVWPSVILHFINNAASVVWMKYCTAMTGAVIFVAALSVLTLVSLTVIVKKRKRYLSLVRAAMTKGDSFEYTYAPIALMAICLYIAAANLFVR